MKKILFSICLLAFISCSPKKENSQEQQNNVPQALQDEKKSSVISISKRGPEDIVDELYEEAIKNSSELKDIEKKLSGINEKKNDSLRVFENYKFKNQDYYASADRHLNSIQDSILKKEIEAAFEKDKTGYNNIITRLNELENELDKQSLYATDHQVVLKLFVTLNMMQQFRKNSTPPLRLLGSVLNEYKILNLKLDSTILKNK
jgi:hypothetical protein